MGNKCCASHTQAEFRSQHSPKKRSAHKNSDQNAAECHLCKLHLSFDQYYKHLDLIHYALKTQQQNKDVFNCILCGYKAISLEGHETHLKMKHKYLKRDGKSIPNSHQTHEQIKARIIEISPQEVKKIKQNRVQIDGEQMNMAIFQKQYGAVEFSNDKSRGDLIWRYIFQKYPQAKYYTLEHEAGQKTIVSKGKIFIKG